MVGYWQLARAAVCGGSCGMYANGEIETRSDPRVPLERPRCHRRCTAGTDRRGSRGGEDELGDGYTWDTGE